MARDLGIVNTATDYFITWINKTNDVLSFIKNEAVSVNSTVSTVSGNGFVLGLFGANTIVATTIRGGNVSDAANLAITSNTTFSGANVTFVNLTSTGTVVLNVGSFSGAVTVTNTVNVSANLTVGGTSLLAGINATSVALGNSTANVAINSTSQIIANSTGLFTATPTSLSIGNSTVNAVANSTALVVNAVVAGGRINVGSNVYANLTSVFIGNATVNTVINSSSITTNTVYAGTLSGNVSANTIIVGNSTVNTVVNSSAVVANALVQIGANVYANATGLFVGNATVNAFVNSTTFSGTAANSTRLNGQLASFYANVTNPVFSVNATVGNATVNVSIQNTSITVSNSTLSVSLNSFALSVGNVVANTVAVSVGANVLINTSTVFLGNSTVNSTFTSGRWATTGNIVANSDSIFWGNVAVGRDLTVTGNLVVSGSMTYTNVSTSDLIPSANGQNLGNVVARWNLYGINIDYTGNMLGNTVTFTGVANTANVNVTGVVNASGNVYCSTLRAAVQIESGAAQEAQIRTTTVNTAGLSLVSVDSFPAASFRTAKYVIQVKDTSTSANSWLATELMILCDGGNAPATEYATIFSNVRPGVFSTSVAAGTVSLDFTPAVNNTTIRIFRTLLVA